MSNGSDDKLRHMPKEKQPSVEPKTPVDEPLVAAELLRTVWAPRLALFKQIEALAFRALDVGMSKAAWVERAHGAFERAEFELEEAVQIMQQQEATKKETN